MRRRFFLLAGPAIVAAPSLMKVSALVMPQAMETTLPDLVCQFPIRSAHVRNLLVYGSPRVDRALVILQSIAKRPAPLDAGRLFVAVAATQDEPGKASQNPA